MFVSTFGYRICIGADLGVTRECVGEVGGLGAQDDLVRVVLSHLAFVDLTDLHIRQGRAVEEAINFPAMMDSAQAR